MAIKKFTIQIFIFIFLVIIIRFYQHQNLKFGSVPIFTSNSLTKKILSSKPDNRPILIHFWATWCTVCKLENSNIQYISKDYLVLNIAIQSGTDAEIMQYANKNNLKLDNIINDSSGTIAKLFGVNITPVSFIIDPDGKITFTEVGYTTTLGLWLRLWWSNF